MTHAEVARMKVALRFLREHRQTLKLRVNAAEDLLLNGKREPTHRGVCQHLLSKLDRARVLSAADSLPPAKATELLGGIVRFAPEIPYILAFLKCVKASQDRSQTAAALTQALEQLDFGETSAAQMRDLLQLIVDVFPEHERPVFAFSLLNGTAFRAAFDRTSEGWPESLSRLLLPLRALHRWLGHKERGGRRERSRVPLSELREGALLLLGASQSSLLELGEGLRRRLFDSATDAFGASPGSGAEAAAEALVALYRSLAFRDAAARAAAALELARALLRKGREKLARQVLRAEVELGGDARDARRWLTALDGVRVGNLAFERRARGREPSADAGPAADRWQHAWHVPTQRDVLVRLVRPEDAAALAAHVDVRRRALLPGVAPLVESVLAPSGPAKRPYIALAWQGPALSGRLTRGSLGVALALAWCVELCLLANAVAQCGLMLPDLSLQRFSVEGDGRLWLSDLWGAAAATPEEALAAHAANARHACLELLGALDLDVLSPAAAQVFAAESSLETLIDALRAT